LVKNCLIRTVLGIKKTVDPVLDPVSRPENNVLDPDLTRINVLDPDSQHCLSKPSIEAIRVYCFMIFTRHLTLFSESFGVILFFGGGGEG
jgi:hypothetical protein